MPQSQPQLFDILRNDRMTLDEYIKHLQALRELLPGDTPVQKWLPAKGRHNAPVPTVAFAKTFRAVGSDRRVAVGQFWQDHFDLPNEQGHRCVRV